MTAFLMVLLGLVMLVGLTALFTVFGDPERIDEEEARRVWRKRRRTHRASNYYNS